MVRVYPPSFESLPSESGSSRPKLMKTLLTCMSVCRAISSDLLASIVDESLPFWALKNCYFIIFYVSLSSIDRVRLSDCGSAWVHPISNIVGTFINLRYARFTSLYFSNNESLSNVLPASSILTTPILQFNPSLLDNFFILLNLRSSIICFVVLMSLGLLLLRLF